MFFILAKTLGVLIQFPMLMLEALALGLILLWTRWRRIGRLIACAAGFTLIAFSITPLSLLPLRPLEDRFTRPSLTEAPTGVIVLGGAADELLSQSRNALSLNDAGERIVEAVALARKFPTARLVFTGGSGHFFGEGKAEADVVREIWRSLGVPDDRMTFEDRSRDTWENAIFTQALLHPKADEKWLLVTSAAHMPRSVGIFRKIGFSVVPYPVDYRTAGSSLDFIGFRRMDQSMAALEIASHEWIGLIAYYMAGKSSALFPAP